MKRNEIELTQSEKNESEVALGGLFIILLIGAISMAILNIVYM